MNIEVTDLNKKLDEFALKNISIKVPKGKIVGLIGENGAGKTSLIKCIVNAMHKDTGSVKLFEKEYDCYLKDSIGIVYDDSFLNENFSIKEINSVMKNIYSKWDEKLFFNYMTVYKIPFDKKYKKLSTGMKKKLEIACAMAHHPKVLILDEPTSGLDPIIRSEILDMFHNFVENNDNSILLSTHITSDLEHIADDVIFISNGEIIFDNTLKDIKNTYTILNVNKEDFDKIDKKDIIRYKENRLDYMVLIYKENFKEKYNDYKLGITTLDDIMLLYIRGIVCED